MQEDGDADAVLRLSLQLNVVGLLSSVYYLSPMPSILPSPPMYRSHSSRE